jgi:glycosyltransferase involved in cell wall biosynthesis
MLSVMVEAGTLDRPCGIRDYAALLCAGMPVGMTELRHVRVPSEALSRNHPWALASARRMVIADARALPPSRVIHAHYSDFSWNGVRSFEDCYECFVRACRRPVLVTLHEHPWFRGRHLWDRSRTPADFAFACLARQWPLPRSLPVQVLARHAGIHVHHDWQRAILLEHGVPGEAVEVIPHPVPDCVATPEASAAFKQRFNLQEKRVLAMTGFVFERKRHDRVLSLLPSLPPDVVLCLMGGANGPAAEQYLKTLLQRARELGVSDRFMVTGYLTELEMNAGLRAADAFVAPYAEVSSSGSVARCMAAGAPIVAGICPTFRELADQEAGLILVNAENREELAEALITVLSRGDRSAGLREKNARYAARWSFRAVAQQILDWYERCLERRAM